MNLKQCLFRIDKLLQPLRSASQDAQLSSSVRSLEQSSAGAEAFVNDMLDGFICGSVESIADNWQRVVRSGFVHGKIKAELAIQ